MNDNCGVYAIANKINNKKYIGSSMHIDKRFIEHKQSLNIGNHHNKRLQQDWSEHKEEDFAFEILELCPRDILFKIEQKYINKFKTFLPEFGHNKDIPYKKDSIKPKRSYFPMMLEETTIKNLKVAAAEQGKDANEILEELLEKYFKKKEGKNHK